MPDITVPERDVRHLHRAIELARLARGQVSPNPIVGAVIVNQVRPRDLGLADLEAARTGSLDREQIAADLQSAKIDVTHDLVDSLLVEASDHAERRALEEAQRAIVQRLDAPSYELPRLANGIDLGGLYELAARLKEQGLS